MALKDYALEKGKSLQAWYLGILRGILPANTCCWGLERLGVGGLWGARGQSRAEANSAWKAFAGDI